MSEALKPCPFCGNQVEYYEGNYERYVRCEICLTQGPIEYTDEAAIAAWNQRKLDEEAAERFTGIRANDQKIFQHYTRAAIKLLLTEERLNCIRAIEQIIGDRRITEPIADSIRVMPWPSNAPSEMTASPWRNFRKERPADGQKVLLWWQSTLEVGCETARYQEQYESFSLGSRSIPPGNSLIKCVFWQPLPAPPTAEEIEAAMKGEE